jgi:hypothetical protein
VVAFFSRSCHQMEIAALSLTGFVSIVLAKLRCVWHGSCVSCAYNDPHVSLGASTPIEEWSPEDSQKTLPHPHPSSTASWISDVCRSGLRAAFFITKFYPTPVV